MLRFERFGTMLVITPVDEFATIKLPAVWFANLASATVLSANCELAIVPVTWLNATDRDDWSNQVVIVPFE